MVDSKAIGRIIETNIMEVLGVIKRVLMVAEINISIEIGMIPMTNANLLIYNLYLHPQGPTTGEQQAATVIEESKSKGGCFIATIPLK